VPLNGVVIYHMVDKGRSSAVVNGDVVNGEMVSGETTPSSDGDSLTLDASSDGDAAVGGRVYKQDVITITGRQENCEAARDAMLVCSCLQPHTTDLFVAHLSSLGMALSTRSFLVPQADLETPPESKITRICTRYLKELCRHQCYSCCLLINCMYFHSRSSMNLTVTNNSIVSNISQSYS